MSMNATYAYFTASAKAADGIAQTATLLVTVSDDTAGSINSSTITSSTKIIPGDILTINGSVVNDGNVQAYVILEFKVTTTKSGAGSSTVEEHKFYSLSGTNLIEITGSNGTYSVNAFAIDAPNENRTNTYSKNFKIDYLFNVYDYDNSYKNAQATYTVTAHAIQTANIASAATATTLLLEKANSAT